ncbi:MAG: STT3 domain-containing protein [Promethearchaeota archaeon]
MSKISESIQNLINIARAKLNVRRENILLFIALFLTVFLAIMIRLTPILRGPYIIKAFDPWIQYYNAKFLSEHSLYEYFNWHDSKSWYPEGFDRGTLRPGLTFTVVIIYKIFNFFGLSISLYEVCYFFPAFMGGITVLVMYFLGKEILNRGCGLFAAFFLAFNVGHMQRTMAGFFDNETIGVFATLMTFLFFIKAVKTGKITYSMIGGLFLGYLGLSWGGYSYVYLMIPLITFILILIKKYDENVLIAYAGVEGMGFLINSLFIIYNYDDLFSDYKNLGVFLFTIIIIFYNFLYNSKNKYPRFYAGFLNGIKWGTIPTILILSIIVWVKPELIPLGFGARLKSIITPLIREDLSLVASVAEHAPSAWSVFYYNTLIPMIILPLGLFFCFKRSDVSDVFLIIFLLTLFYLTGSMIRIILLFAPAASLMGAYGLVNVLKLYGNLFGERKFGISRKRRRQIKRTLGESEIFTVYFIIGFLVFAQILHGTNISINQLSYTQMIVNGQFHDWEETLTWMENNLEGDDVVACWWDYGYWITPIGNVTSVNDNATVNSTRIGLTGMGMMQTNEIYSARAFKRLKADYVLVYFGFFISGFAGDEGKWQWMVRICNDNYEIYKNKGWEEDNWEQDAVFDESKYINSSTGKYENYWFQSQLFKLLTYEEPTNPNLYSTNTLKGYYANYINNQKDDNGNTYASHIPPNGLYDFKVFKKAYFSRNGLVKLYKIDYTALESSFSIENPKVYNNGYGTFVLHNTGSRDLNIDNVYINNIKYNFTTSELNNNTLIPAGQKTTIFVDTSLNEFHLKDTVFYNVTAEAEALENKKYIFSNYTEYFFVEGIEPGSIKINKENSRVEQIDETCANVYLEIENDGGSIEVLDSFYINENIPENQFNTSEIEYLEGSQVLAPGEKVSIYLPNASASFYPLGTANSIGVITLNGISDELLLSSNYPNYELSILNEERIASPEAMAVGNGTLRDTIQLNESSTHAYLQDNGKTRLEIEVKNTGDTVFGIDSIILSKQDSWTKIYGDFILTPGQSDTIIMETTQKDMFQINDRIKITITGSFNGEIKASDVGYVHVMKKQASVRIIETSNNASISHVRANETGQVVIKNTGNTAITLTQLTINNTIMRFIPQDIEFLYGDEVLFPQECAYIAFSILELKINESDNINIRISATDTSYATTIKATVDARFHAIRINDVGTSATVSENLVINVENIALLDLTIESVFINGTQISLSKFTFSDGETIEGLGGTTTLTTPLSNVGSFVSGNKLEILIRTAEGAEDVHLETVS